MAPQQINHQFSTPLHSMTQDDFLSLGLLILSQNQKSTTNPNQNQTVVKDLHFKCSICGKPFPSYQALGGHKSSHRQPKNRAHMKQIDIKQNLINLLDSSEKGTHRCNVCFKSFLTGQALGGHKRCHYWDGSNGSVSDSSAPVSTLSSVRDFDLNLPARNVWGEEEEVLSPLPAKKHRLV